METDQRPESNLERDFEAEGVSILKWPDSAVYWTVKLHNQSYGCLMYDTNVRVVFHPFTSFKQLDAYGQVLLKAAAEQYIGLIKITARLKA